MVPQKSSGMDDDLNAHNPPALSDGSYDIAFRGAIEFISKAMTILNTG